MTSIVLGLLHTVFPFTLAGFPFTRTLCFFLTWLLSSFCWSVPSSSFHRRSEQELLFYGLWNPSTTECYSAHSSCGSFYYPNRQRHPELRVRPQFWCLGVPGVTRGGGQAAGHQPPEEPWLLHLPEVTPAVLPDNVRLQPHVYNPHKSPSRCLGTDLGSSLKVAGNFYCQFDRTETLKGDY